MAVISITDLDLYVGSRELSSYASKVTVADEVGETEVNTFGGAGWSQRIGKLRAGDLNVEGFQSFSDASPDDVDATLWPLVGTYTVVTVSPIGNTEGDRAYFSRRLLQSHSPIDVGEVGDPSRLNISWVGGTAPLIGGVLLAARAARTANGNGGAYELGAASDTQRAWMAVHVLAISGAGAALTVNLQSDDAAGMATPTTRVSTPSLTAVGDSLVSAMGPFTDTFWRATWGISGTTPSVTFVVAAGIR